MEDFYKIWLQHNPQARLTADEEKVLGRKIQTGKAITAKRKGAMLSTDEQKICSEGEKALNKLILCNIPLGIYFANKYAAKYPDIGLTMDDISQEALMGVMKAAERYDPDADCKARFCRTGFDGQGGLPFSIGDGGGQGRGKAKQFHFDLPFSAFSHRP